MQFIAIRNWRYFQHYKDRNPPWIKLHRELLTSVTWVSASNEDRVLAIAIMMLAAATDNKIPSNPAYLRRVAYLDFDPDISFLVEIGFIEIIEENSKSASNNLADASNLHSNARPETETETEKRREEKIVAASPPKKGSRLPLDWMLSHEDHSFAIKKGLSEADIETEAELFANYWHSKPGAGGVKLDWSKTWHSWVINGIKRDRQKQSTSADDNLRWLKNHMRAAQ